ncbi:protein kinase domain-containing protein [Melittangium boletus]
MAEVFLAKAAGPMGFEKTLVLKRILPHLAEEPTFVQMFLSEAKLAARLTHPHIVQIFDFGESEGAYFLAMEYVDGPSLRTLVKRAQAQGTSLPPTLCARLVSHSCEGLAFAHDFVDPDTGEREGLIHRDISPDNILLSRQGAVKVVDFGIAKAASQGHRTQSGVIKGKLAYMPPEQLRARDMDRRVDVYALGVVLYELLTGQRPYSSDSDAGLMQAILFEPPVPAVQLRPDLPPSLSRILDQALAKDVSQRYPDCHALQADLEDFIVAAGRSVTTQQVTQLIAQLTSNTTSPELSSAQSMVGPLDPSGPLQKPAERHRLVTPSPSQETEPETRVAPLTGTSRETAGDKTEQATHMLVGTPPANVKPRSSGRWIPALVGGVLFLAGGGMLLWRMSSPPEAPRPAPMAERHEETPLAQAEPTLPPAPVPSATPVESAPEAPAPAAPVAEAPTPKQPSPPVAAILGPKREPSRAKASTPAPPKVLPTGTLELRVRPYATVIVDGKDMGDTPIKPLRLTVGHHTVKLVNQTLSKTATRGVTVRAEETTLLKVNLLAE